VVASFVSYVLRTNFSIVAPAVVDELGISEVQLGLVLSAFALGYALFQFPGGVFGDAVGPRLAVTLLAVAWGALTVLTGLVPASAPPAVVVAALVGIRFAVGVAHAPIFPVMTGGMVANWFPVHAWGLPNGLSSAGLTLGAAATGPLVVALSASLGWRGSFLATAPAAFALAAVWWVATRDHPREHPRVVPSELERIEAGRPPGVGSVAKPERPWRSVLGSRDLLLLSASYFCMNYVFYLFFNWFFYYLVEIRGIDSETAAWLSAVQWILGAAGAAAGGLLCDGTMRRLGARRGARIGPVIGLVGSAALLAAGAFATHPTVAVVCLAACFGLNQLTEASYWAAAISVGGRHASSAAGVLNTGGNLVGFAGALLVPIAAQAVGWPWAIASGALMALLGALLWGWIRADRSLAVADRG
jgi:ACS family glucarate transporter-like MFS transporter